MRILVVDDDTDITELLQTYFSELGYTVDIAHNGNKTESLTENLSYDLIILDLVLPDIDGVDLCRRLREKTIKTPIIMISGIKLDTVDMVTGLDNGADDYLVKPFQLTELSARIRALLRREPNNIFPIVKFGNCRLVAATRQVWQGEKEILLTAKEFAILEYLAYHPNSIVTRVELERHVWTNLVERNSNVVDVHIKNLRKKLENGILIETIRGMGYRLKI
jgi:DNA-binding response OmpR family regulator